MNRAEQVQAVLKDVELETAAKGAFCILAFLLNGSGSFADIRQHCRDHPPNLEFSLKRLMLRKWITRSQEAYSIVEPTDD